MKSTRRLTETALLAAFITVSGAIKIPGIVPGTEFQLSAPLAVAVCSVFGFTQYITAGILSSAAGLLLGTQNLMQVGIAFIFRLTAGGILLLFRNRWLAVLAAGPIASAAARVVLANLLGLAALPLIAAALPGMVYTVTAVWPLTLLLRKVQLQTERMSVHVIQR